MNSFEPFPYWGQVCSVMSYTGSQKLPKHNTCCSYLALFKWCTNISPGELLACFKRAALAEVTYWAVWVTEWGRTADTLFVRAGEWRLNSRGLISLLLSIIVTAVMSKLALKEPNGVTVLFYLEVSVRLAVWVRWRTGAEVWWRACRDMVWASDLSLPAVENTGSPLIHTGTAERRRGGLQRGDIKKENVRYRSV